MDWEVVVCMPTGLVSNLTYVTEPCCDELHHNVISNVGGHQRHARAHRMAERSKALDLGISQIL